MVATGVSTQLGSSGVPSALEVGGSDIVELDVAKAYEELELATGAVAELVASG